MGYVTRVSLRMWLLVVGLLALSMSATAAPLQTFTVKDYLRHQWTDEIVHFPISYTGALPQSLMLTDTDGQPVPCQITGLARKNGKVTGTVWTVVSLPPQGTATFHLQPGTSASTALRLQAQGDEYILRNECLALRLPRFPTALAQPVDLTMLPAPLLAVSDKDGKNWLGQGAWTNAGEPLLVKHATMTVMEEGPVRIAVRYTLTFTDDRVYQADITLGARQDAVSFTDHTNIEAPKAAFRFAFQPGLGADRVYWRNNWFADQGKGLTPGSIDFTKEQVLFNIRPWSFWWAKDLSVSAGFYKEGADPFIGVIAVRPSRWIPYGWDGAERTQLPVTARPGGGLDLTLGLLAWTPTKTDETQLSAIVAIGFSYSHEALAKHNGNDSQLAVIPLHRELAITVGSAAEHVNKDNAKAKLRRQLVKYSEFPLDEVKEFGFDYTPAKPNRQHPFLLFTQADIDRLRRQAKTVPAVQAEVTKVTGQIKRSVSDAMVAKLQQQPDAWQTFYRDIFRGQAFYYGTSALAYMGSDEQQYGVMLAAGVKGMARENIVNVLDEPWRPCLGGFAHVYPGNWTNLLFAYDALASTDYLTAEEKAEINASLVFGAYVLAHDDYWNTRYGLCSANPNMTALVKLPRGLMALYLDGHPESDSWLQVAETELRDELKSWIAPGGAWVECPGYQGASLDPIFPLMQALKNVKGKNYFLDPQVKATMDYYSFLLTPPDKRFRLNAADILPSPMILPSFGDMWTGTTTVFPGWVAQSTAQSDPAFSARQQFAWKAMRNAYNTMYAMGYTPALTDPELPAAPPAELSRAFPGFGSIMRTSWTDPNASYVAHRTGPFLHHYHDDFNAVVYYAKGAPLCVDFGNLYVPSQRSESWYHSRVSFNTLAETPGQLDMSSGKFIDFRTLPHTIDYSVGQARGSKKQQHDRHLLMVKSADQLGAHYLVMRDITMDGQPNQEYFWNLWCLSKDPEIAGNVVHFPGQLGVDLDAHLLSPANPQFAKDRWDWKQYIGTWGIFAEEQYGVHVRKLGSAEDYVAVLYPRAAGQGPAQVTALANGRGAAVAHMEGTDVVLLSPGKPATVSAGTASLTGEVAFARTYRDGTLRLAALRGDCTVKLADWVLVSAGPTALEVKGKQVTGESSGDAHTVHITLPAAAGAATVTLDGKRLNAKRVKNLVSFNLPDGSHTFTLALK